MSLKTPFSLGGAQSGVYPIPRLPSDQLVTIHPVIGFCAVATILLPAHPSLQSVFIAYEIPSPLVAMLFAVPVMYGVLTKRVFSYNNLAVMLPFFAYIAWMLFRTIGSPALGQENTSASLQGIILIPLALLCALVGAKSSPYSARAIGIVGFLALIHYCVLHLVGNSIGESTGVRYLSSDPEIRNYQATSFYIGILGVLMTSLIVRGKRSSVFYGAGGLILTLMVMGTVGARATIVALLASSLIVILVSAPSRAIWVMAVFGTLGTLAITLGFIFGLFSVETIQNYFTVVDRFMLLAEDGDSSQRIRLFSSAIQMWFASPTNFFVGGGVGAYPEFLGETEAGWYPHNFILESLAEGGLVAGLLLIWVGVVFVTRFRRLESRKLNVEDVFLGALAVYILIMYQFTSSIASLWMPTFFVALFLFSQGRLAR